MVCGELPKSCDIWTQQCNREIDASITIGINTIAITRPSQGSLWRTRLGRAARKGEVPARLASLTMALIVSEEKFQHILRILTTNVDGRQKVAFALTKIPGVGRRFANLVCKKAEIDLNKRCGWLCGTVWCACGHHATVLGLLVCFETARVAAYACCQHASR